METVGIREFRENLASYLEGSVPLAITRHGETVAFFLPVVRKRTDEDRAALLEAAGQVREMLAAKGISEEEIVDEFKSLRKHSKK